MQKVDKPWGYELIWAHTERYVGKVLHINAGESLSLQYHEEKEETILVQTGRLRLTLGDEVKELAPGEIAHIKPTVIHRMEAVETTDVVEVSTPELTDVVRLEDRYGRSPAEPAVAGEGTKIGADGKEKKIAA